MLDLRARVRELDGLRALAVVAVFLHHAYHLRLLWMGVDLFFVLSGFLITGILVQQKTKRFANYLGDFYARRARRILPPYILLIGLVALILPGPWMRYWYLYLGGMNFVAPLKLPHPSALSHVWSLAIEEQFYLLWPLAVFFLNRRRLLWCLWSILILAPGLRFFCTPLFDTSWAVYMLTPFRMDTLAAGALIALFWPDWQKRLQENAALRRKILWACAAGVSLASLGALGLTHLGYSPFTNRRLGNMALYEATLLIAVGVFLFVLLGFGCSVLRSWPVYWLGRVSYSFYLVHFLALQLLPRHHAIPAFFVSVVYATLMWIWVERPILSSKRPEASTLIEPN